MFFYLFSFFENFSNMFIYFIFSAIYVWIEHIHNF